MRLALHRNEAMYAGPNQNVMLGTHVVIRKSARPRIKPATGGRAGVRFLATNDGKGSRAQTTSLGHGTVWIDSKQVAQGYSQLRIASHEFGHILGLPDHHSGPCSELMSGGGPGTGCKNPNPDKAEVSRVTRLFNGNRAATLSDVPVDSPPCAHE